MKTRSKKIKTVIIAVFCLAFWITVLWLCQRMLVPKYQTGVVEGSMVEEYYKDKGYDIITLTTFGFQAPEFYKKLGYEVEFVREDKDPKLAKYFLAKTLI